MHHPPKNKTALIRVISKSNLMRNKATVCGVKTTLLLFLGNIWEFVSHVVCHCSYPNSQPRDSQPGFRSVPVKISFRTTHSPVCSNSKRFEICAPASSHSRALCGSPLMRTGYKPSQLRKSPPSTSFYLPIGR